MNRRDFIRNIPKLKEIYVIHSQATKLPFVFCHEDTMDDYVVICTKEEAAREKAQALIGEKKPALVVKCREKEIAQMFGSLKVLGVNAVQFIGREPGEDYLVQVGEFLRWQDFSGQPAEKRPVENPGLQLSLLYFLQEYRRAADAPGRGDVQELSEEVYVNMTRSRFLLGAQPVEDEARKEQSALLLVKNKEGEAFLPLFTDVFELKRFTKDKPPKQIIAADFKRVLTLLNQGETAGVVLNPGSGNYPVSREKYMEIDEAFAPEEEKI
ncbi:MAG: SseB family protein [Lachnospiraceae bacterium]|nr:SseB family protein [Lachnospiraceae bacterium]